MILVDILSYNLTNGFARDLQLFQTERIRFNLNAAERYLIAIKTWILNRI